MKTVPSFSSVQPRLAKYWRTKHENSAASVACNHDWRRIGELNMKTLLLQWRATTIGDVLEI
jgi:hypothetical protein